MTTTKHATGRAQNSVLTILTRRSVPFEEGLRLVNDQNLTLASNARLQKAFDKRQEPLSTFRCWSGTMTAYVEPGSKLPEKIEYVDSETGYKWVFNVPKQFRGEANAILVAEHPGYTLEIDGNNRVVHATNVDLVKNFPEKDGWYKGDPNHNIPIISQSNPDMHLCRIGKRVGPVARGSNGFGSYGRLCVGLGNRPSDGLGVVVEATEVILDEAPLYPLSEGHSGGSALLETTLIQLRLTRDSPGTLIVNGSPEQLDAAVRLLETFRNR